MQKQTIDETSHDINEERDETNSTDISGSIHCLSNNERLWLWCLTADLAVVARIIGDVDEKNLLHAINATRQMHPMLNVRVILDDKYDVWFSTANVPKTIFRTVPRRSETQWVDEIRQEYLVPFEPEIGPLIRFVLVYSSSVSELIVFANHSICDGMSLANLIRDILVFYAEPAKEIQVIYPFSIADYLPHQHYSLSKPEGIDAIDNCNLQWRKSPHYFTQADFNEVHKAYWKKYRQNTVLLELEPKETSILVNKCRDNGVTITSASTVAFLAAYRDVTGLFSNDKSNVTISYDLRRHLGKDIGDIFCLFTQGFACSFKYTQEKSFWENAQELHEEILKGIERLEMLTPELEWSDPTLISAYNLAYVVQLVPEAFERTKNLLAFAHDTENIIFTLISYAKTTVPIILNTNLGRLDFPETYGDLSLNRMVFVPPANIIFPVLGGIGINGRLAFTLNFIEDVCGDGSISKCMIKVRNRALEYLGFPEKANNKAYESCY